MVVGLEDIQYGSTGERFGNKLKPANRDKEYLMYFLAGVFSGPCNVMHHTQFYSIPASVRRAAICLHYFQFTQTFHLSSINIANTRVAVLKNP